MERYEEENLEANTQYANRYLSYYYDDEDCLVISARLPPEQGATLIKSIESTRESLLRERKNVPAGTFSEVSNNFDPDLSEPLATQRADALVLIAENFHSDDIKTRNGGERCQMVIHAHEKVLKEPHSIGRCECGVSTASRKRIAKTLASVTL